MPSSDGDADLDPETEAAIRRLIHDELRSVVRALSQIGGGLLVGFLALSVVAGGLIAIEPPPVVVGLVGIGFLLLIAYGWRLPPFR